MSSIPDDYAEFVLDLVTRIPPGRMSTYGVIAEIARDHMGKGGPRNVGHVLSHFGGDVPWWRVCRAGGRLAAHKVHRQAELLRAEGVRVGASGTVDMREVGWPD